VALPPEDIDALKRRGMAYTVTEEGGMTCVMFPTYALPKGFKTQNSDLLLRLNPGYPDVAPDMWWFDPPVQRMDGASIQATEHFEHHLGRRWQRWSRHLTAAQWKSGIDSIESFLAIIQRELIRSSPEQGVALCR
jgi:hypothetical protein